MDSGRPNGLVDQYRRLVHRPDIDGSGQCLDRRKNCHWPATYFVGPTCDAAALT
jgi:hypothetical protein